MGKESNPFNIIRLKYGSIQRTSCTLPENGDTITNPYYIANTFDNYFAPIVETTKKIIKYLNKNVSDYLSNESGSTIFLKPTDNKK